MNISVPLASGGTEVTYGIKPLAAGTGRPSGTYRILGRVTHLLAGKHAAAEGRTTYGTAGTPPEHRVTGPERGQSGRR